MQMRGNVLVLYQNQDFIVMYVIHIECKLRRIRIIVLHYGKFLFFHMQFLAYDCSSVAIVQRPGSGERPCSSLFPFTFPCLSSFPPLHIGNESRPRAQRSRHELVRRRVCVCGLDPAADYDYTYSEICMKGHLPFFI